MNYEKDLEKLREDLNHARNIKTRSEIALEGLQKEEENIIKDLEDLGVSPENLDQTIKDLDEEIKALLKEAEDLMPYDILEKVKR